VKGGANIANERADCKLQYYAIRFAAISKQGPNIAERFFDIGTFGDIRQHPVMYKLKSLVWSIMMH
jgi:hypothetical protein